MDALTPKNDINACHIRESPPLTLADGDILMKIDKFSFTANNKSYAEAGKSLRYFDFWPSDDETMGRVPVWGLATVVVSRHSQIEVGKRAYGYFPISSYAVLRPGRVSALGFTDVSAHRAELPAVYNGLNFCDADPLYVPQAEDAMLLLRPLFLTSWLLDDFLEHNQFFGASTVTIV